MNTTFPYNDDYNGTEFHKHVLEHITSFFVITEFGSVYAIFCFIMAFPKIRSIKN
jgi:hypothetical protein